MPSVNNMVYVHVIIQIHVCTGITEKLVIKKFNIVHSERFESKIWNLIISFTKSSVNKNVLNLQKKKWLESKGFNNLGKYWLHACSSTIFYYDDCHQMNKTYVQAVPEPLEALGMFA